MLMRLIDFLKSKQITAMFTSLTGGSSVLEQSEVGVSSLMDTWLLLRDVELGGERNRVMYILKSRGMAHSNQLREFLLTDHGIELEDMYIGMDGVLTGSSRLAQEAREKAAATARGEEIEAKRRELERARQASEAQIAAIRLDYQAKEDELRRAIAQKEACEQRLVQARVEMGHSRKADSDGSKGPSPASSIKGENA
jgi:circadian clock protein KaiC